MKRALKYIAVTLVSLLALLLVLPLCIYIPAVQRWGKTEICRYVNRSTDMQLSIGDLSLRFPFKLHIDDILLLTAPADTLLQSESMEVGVAPLGLLKRHVQVNEFVLQGVRFRFASTDSTLTLSARVKEFATRGARIDLKSSLIDLPSSQLQDGDITLNITGQQPDTTETASPPLDWRISVGELALSQIHYAMQMRPTIQQLDASIGPAALRRFLRGKRAYAVRSAKHLTHAAFDTLRKALIVKFADFCHALGRRIDVQFALGGVVGAARCPSRRALDGSGAVVNAALYALRDGFAD